MRADPGVSRSQSATEERRLPHHPPLSVRPAGLLAPARDGGGQGAGSSSGSLCRLLNVALRSDQRLLIGV